MKQEKIEHKKKLKIWSHHLAKPPPREIFSRLHTTVSLHLDLQLFWYNGSPMSSSWLTSLPFFSFSLEASTVGIDAMAESLICITIFLRGLADGDNPAVGRSLMQFPFRGAAFGAQSASLMRSDISWSCCSRSPYCYSVAGPTEDSSTLHCVYPFHLQHFDNV